MIGVRKIAAAAVFSGLAAFGAALLATEFSWLARENEIDGNLMRIGEIYLDGLAASVKTSLERGSTGDVDRRLRSAMNEQNGIAERAILVFNDAGEIANQAGFRGLFGDARLRLAPGSVIVDRQEQTMFVARRLNDGAAHVAVALNIEPMLASVGFTRSLSLLGDLLAGLLSAAATALALVWGSRGEANPAVPAQTPSA